VEETNGKSVFYQVGGPDIFSDEDEDETSRIYGLMILCEYNSKKSEFDQFVNFLTAKREWSLNHPENY
jgi:hypothetical protein